MRVGVKPAPDNCADKAIEKHPACAAPINSSGLVPAPSAERERQSYDPSNAPLPNFTFPLPSRRLPFHSASAVLVGMNCFLSVPSYLSKHGIRQESSALRAGFYEMPSVPGSGGMAYQSTGLPRWKKPPVGPSEGSVANQTDV